MPLAPGTRLGPYEILSALGAGGMGEVWKARDTRLNRFVAIKATLSPFSERFGREARAIAAVNHPHVCSLYDVGPDYLVMEYVEGESLNGPMPPAQAVALAGQILDALDAAHKQGIVHRDLKPGNILLTRSGVKVLDFGLAKITQASAVSGAGVPETTTLSLTAEGSILGTLPYMAPEQVEGRDADARSDIFAFGVVLYELIAGRRPFMGDTPAHLAAAILREEPRPLTAIEPRTPPALADVVRTCLEKDPDKRWQSARDVKHALELIGTTPRQSSPARSSRLWQAVAALLAAVSLGLGAWVFQPRETAPSTVLEVAPPERVTGLANLSLSPDGRRLASTSTGYDNGPGGIWVRDLDSEEWRLLPGTQDASSIFWSPDSQSLGFIVRDTLKRVDITGGPPETIASLPPPMRDSGAWSRHGDIVLGGWSGGSGGPLLRVSQAGGPATAVTEVDLAKGEFVHTGPTFLPDGKRFLYFRSGPSDIEGMYVGSLDVDAGNQSRERILATNVPAVFANGYMFFVRAGTLMAQRFDVGRLTLEGVAVPVARNVLVTWDFNAMLAVSDDVLTYRTASAPGTSQLTWVNRDGKILANVGQPGTEGRAVLSPDGKRAVAKDAAYNESGDLWMIDVATGQRTRFTFTQDVFSPGVWSPDSTRVAYAAGHVGDTIFEKAASGLGDQEVLFREPGIRHFPTSWSSDGRFLLYHTENTPNTGYDLWALSVSDRKPYRLLGEVYNEWAGVFSPDMRWVAYVSLEMKTPADVYVRPFRVSSETGEPSLAAGQWQISQGGGSWPQWRLPGEIHFNRAPSAPGVFVKTVDGSGAAFVTGAQRQLPFPAARGIITTPQADGDGQRFLVEVPEARRGPLSYIRVRINWPELLKQ